MSRKITDKELREHCTEKSAWIAIRGKVYDVTEFLSRHPGGFDALRYGIGRDSTVVFETYHNLERVQPVRNKLPVVGELVDAELPTFIETSAFHQRIIERVYKRFKDERLDMKNSASVWLTYAGIMLTLWFSYYQQYFGWMSHAFYTQAIAAIVGGFCCAQIGLHILHDASHFSVTHNPLVWKILGATHDFFNGLSFVWWSYRHTMGHHPYTNIVDADPDIYVKPKGNFRRIFKFQPWEYFYKYQHIFAPLLYGGLGVKIRLQDLKVLYLTEVNKPIHVNPQTVDQHIQTLGGKAFFFFHRILLPVMLGYSWTRVLLLFMLTDLMMSYWLALPFQFNHVVVDVQLPYERSPDIDWAKMQIETSLDYAIDSVATRLAVGALNFQTVHHLFPGILQHHYPLIHEIIKEECEKNGVRYNIQPSLLGALNSHIQHLRKLGREE